MFLVLPGDLQLCLGAPCLVALCSAGGDSVERDIASLLNRLGEQVTRHVDKSPGISLYRLGKEGSVWTLMLVETDLSQLRRRFIKCVHLSLIT